MAFSKRHSFSVQGTMDCEPHTVVEFTKSAPGMWRFPTIPEKCCIYRVPQRLRRVNPEAYTPQLVLIGPLHHSLKSQALESLGDITKTTSIGYLNMEEYKKIYLAKFAERVDGDNTIDGFRRIIEEDKEAIMESYSESTSWIESQEFVEMILHDSVFILEHMLRIYAAYNGGPRTKQVRDDACAYYEGLRTEKTGDIIVDDPCLHATIKEDLMLLENQLPYFILEKLFESIVPQLDPNQTFRNLVLAYFNTRGKVSYDSSFKHFTDMFRCVGLNSTSDSEEEEPSKTTFTRLLRYVNMKMKCGSTKQSKINSKDLYLKKKDESKGVNYMSIKHMYNAAKLHNAGVKFVVMKNQFAMDVRFDNGRLKLPSLWFDEYTEIILRNIMALEQCHYPSNARVCNFVTFLDFLIDSDKDLDLLFVKGILHTWIGEQKSVAEMVNRLRLGLSIDNYAYYNDIALTVNDYYDNPVNRTRAILGRMYFSNMWKGTATVAATLLLVMTLIQTVTSVMQVMQK